MEVLAMDYCVAISQENKEPLLVRTRFPLTVGLHQV